ncbi:hypothetical protein GCM10010844_38030 [Deinococcus radiotolerans]|uniref:Uncharacterized protein n=2 Tax=Deinococcus radiotolerans TaxID=1309407 RepID=A0ABQ2FQ20_9DEIO|nr:hypothetical protein GCM10010844_38030 [Deinococcus radiotolerans]
MWLPWLCLGVIIGALIVGALLKHLASTPTAARPHVATVYAFWESDYHPWIQPRIRVLWRRCYATADEAERAARWEAREQDHHGFGRFDRDCGIGWDVTGPREVTA